MPELTEEKWATERTRMRCDYCDAIIYANADEFINAGWTRIEFQSRPFDLIRTACPKCKKEFNEEVASKLGDFPNALKPQHPMGAKE
jgi:hypothetical protein